MRRILLSILLSLLVGLGLGAGIFSITGATQTTVKYLATWRGDQTGLWTVTRPSVYTQEWDVAWQLTFTGSLVGELQVYVTGQDSGNPNVAGLLLWSGNSTVHNSQLSGTYMICC